MKSKRKNKMKDELVGKIMKKLVGLKEKTYSYIQIPAVKIKKQNAHKSVIKRKLKFEDYKNSLEATQIVK